MLLVTFQSLSASDTSADISINKTGSPDDSTHLATSQNALNDDKYWWNTHSSSDESDDSIGIVGLKDGATWLKSDTKLGGQSSNDHVGHPLVSAQDSPTKQPLVLPTAGSASVTSSGAEDFTHDSLGACFMMFFVYVQCIHIFLIFYTLHGSFDSSVGRAVDCSGILISIGRWFESGSKDFFMICNFL